ncbi:hypothetical protein F4804DRAFT_319030 [Jackrogersella minutella]|nr:hypothetical protein F4804DRAFT_319030 [Jackrogersella minutella]
MSSQSHSNIRPTMESLGLQDTELNFPTSHNRIANFDPSVIRQDALDTRIVVHRDYPALVDQFLTLKRELGTTNEKRLYSQSWTWKDQIARLIEMRPLAFLTSQDSTLLRNGERVSRGTAFWDNMGAEGSDYTTLENYLTYDEIMLGSLLGVSSPSYFINDGNRYNRGEPQEPGTFESRGIIIGLVGPRFERLEHMDSNLILNGVAKKRMHRRLRELYLDFFDLTELTKERFDTIVYMARMRITFEILLLEANDRAKATGQKAYVYVVGLGLGVWKCDRRQPDLYVTAFHDTIYQLRDKLGHIGTIELAYINTSQEIKGALTTIARNQGITVKFSKRNPAAKLGGEEADQLLVLSYAWDGNAFPGNEYWEGSLAGSGDPAAACMSTIAELHNPLVNPNFLKRVHVLQ